MKAEGQATGLPQSLAESWVMGIAILVLILLFISWRNAKRRRRTRAKLEAMSAAQQRQYAAIELEIFDTFNGARRKAHQHTHTSSRFVKTKKRGG